MKRNPMSDETKAKLRRAANRRWKLKRELDMDATIPAPAPVAALVSLDDVSGILASLHRDAKTSGDTAAYRSFIRLAQRLIDASLVGA